MTGAIFGLIGVVVGGLLTGAVEAIRERRAQTTLSRAAARLLSAELSVQQVILQQRADAGDPTSDDMPVVVDWPEQRVVMAKALDDDTWRDVARAYANLVVWHAQSGRAPTSAGEMSTLAAQLETARGALQAFR